MLKLFRMNGSRKRLIGTFSSVEEAQVDAVDKIKGQIEWNDLIASIDVSFPLRFYNQRR